MRKTSPREHTSSPPYEIIAPAGVLPQQFGTQNGSEVLMLLSGKMRVQVSPDRVMDMQYGKPVVINNPYRLFCPEGPGTGRALRITVPQTATGIHDRTKVARMGATRS